MRAIWTVALSLALMPALARAEDKTGTTTSSSQQNTARTGSDPMNTPANVKQRGSAAANTGASADEPKMTDARLAALLHHVNKEEIDAGKLAEKQGKSEEIKTFGQKLVTDHTKADKDLTAAAKKAGVSISESALATKDKEESKVDMNKMDQLKKMSGTEFDRTFAQVMSHDHEQVITMLRDHESDIKSPELKRLVSSLMPVLQSHKDMADQALQQLGSSGQGRSSSETSRMHQSDSSSKSSDSSSKSSTDSSSKSPDKK
jgi:putative membrane protein